MEIIINYIQINDEHDPVIPRLESSYKLPEIARYISFDEKIYWHYVTTTENVFFYAVYDGGHLIGAIHCELLEHNTLYMDIMVIPEYQKKGYGTAILRDIQTDKLPFSFDRIEVSIDETNVASIRLFEKMNFQYAAKEDELLDYVFVKVKPY